MTVDHPCEPAVALRRLLTAIALCAAFLVAVPTARGETDPPDLFIALATLEELEERGAAAWTQAEAEAYLAARAVIDAHFRQDPQGPEARAWFAGQLVDPQTGAEYGWLLYPPATLAAIAGRAETLAMDRALWFAWTVVAPWAIAPVDADPCLAIKAFTLLGAADLSGEDARMARAIPAVAEAGRLLTWFENENRAALIADRPLDRQAVDRAALTSQIITEMLFNGAMDLATLQQGFFFDMFTGRPFTEAEIAEVYAGFDEGLRLDISKARPFFEDMEALYALPTDQVIARLCR